MKYIAIDKEGNVVEPGSTVTDFRGDTATFVAATRANSADRDGKVSIRKAGWSFDSEVYARVVDLEVREGE
jgi:hypothetical protein